MKSKFLLVMLVLISLLAAGCNEEEKYNTAKNEYQQMREEISRLELTTGEDRKLVNGKWTESTLAINEEALKKHQSYAEEAQEREQKMKAAAASR